MDKTILHERVRVTEYHYKDSPEREYILLDTATGRVCLGTSGDPGFCRELGRDEGGHRQPPGNRRPSAEMWLEEWLTIERRIPADWLDDPEWLENGLEETLDSIGIGEALWLANL